MKVRKPPRPDAATVEAFVTRAPTATRMKSGIAPRMPTISPDDDTWDPEAPTPSPPVAEVIEAPSAEVTAPAVEAAPAPSADDGASERAVDPERARQKAEMWRRQGDVRFMLSDFEGAISCYDECLGGDPRHRTAWLHRGVARERMGDLEAAIADYEQASAIDPDDATAYKNRGNAQRALGLTREAIASYDEAIARNPKDPSVFNSRGNARCDLGDLTGAVEDYGLALIADPHYAIAHANRGSCRQRLGLLAAAIGDYRRYLQLGGGRSQGDQDQVEALIQGLQQAQRRRLTA